MKVSITARTPIINLGVSYNPSIDIESEAAVKFCGKWIILNIAAKKICPKKG